MALRDVTVDTNVLLHASNPNEKLCDDASKFLKKMKAANTRLCVDDGFDTTESANRSQIGSEYLEKLHIGTIGHALFFELAKIGRISIIKKAVPEAIARNINQKVRDKSDRVFAKVAHNSQDKTLVSHDYKAFSKSMHKESRAEVKITIVDATVAAVLST